VCSTVFESRTWIQPLPLHACRQSQTLSSQHIIDTGVPADAPPPQFPEAPRLAIIPPVQAEAPRPATPPAVSVAPPSPVPVAPPSPVPVAPLSSPSVAPLSPPRAPPAEAAPVPAPLPSSPPPPPDVPQEPRVLAHQEVPRRAPRERTPLPVKGGPADVGIVLDANKTDGSLVVSELVPGGPAMEGGQIRTGDVLIDVDGYDVAGRAVRLVALKRTSLSVLWCACSQRTVAYGSKCEYGRSKMRRACWVDSPIRRSR
jgi:hypothetical protein